MIGIDAEYIAFTGFAEVPLDIPDPIDAIAPNPTARRASRKGALDHLDRKLRLGRKADVVRHICGLQANRIVRPALRQIERPIDESMAVTNASVVSIDAPVIHDLRIMVTHGFRNQQNAPAKNYYRNANLRQL